MTCRLAAAPVSWAARLMTTGLPSLFRMRFPPRILPRAFAAASAALVRVDIIPASSSATRRQHPLNGADLLGRLRRVWCFIAPQGEMSCTRFRRHRVRCFMEQEVCHGETAVYAGVQA